MQYCTYSDVDGIIAQSMTSATDPTGQTKRNLLLIGKVRDRNLIPDSTVDQYIRWASQEIDAFLSEMYQTPFSPVVQFETTLASEVSEYNSYLVLTKDGSINPGDHIKLQYADQIENVTISEVIGDGIYSTNEAITYPFPAGSRFLHVEFAYPIHWIAVRLAAANIYDKFFAAQASPDKTEYGTAIRRQARSKINEILNGRTILHGVHRIGRRLYDPYIDDQYGLPDGKSERDIDKLE